MSSSTAAPGSIESILAAKLAEPPAQRLPDEHYLPIEQSHYAFDEDSWHAAALDRPDLNASDFPWKSFQLLSWNIDFLVPFTWARMAAALNHIEQVVSRIPSSRPVVIFWQEMCPSDLEQIKAAQWIRDRFFISDMDTRSWKSPLYGTTTLVDRRLSIQRVFRVPWVTKFERDGLFVDVKATTSVGNKTVRLCNTHLESLIADPPVRPLQLEAALTFLQEDGVYAAALAGDLNAIQPFDHTMVPKFGLRDAYLELGGQEYSDEGYTWGQQVPQWMKDKFGCSRMDKILLRGEISARSFERFGVGVKVEDERVRREMVAAGHLEWASDHLGVMAELELRLN
jgi:tyrosyl-DNA phosphodiesterase 2